MGSVILFQSRLLTNVTICGGRELGMVGEANGHIGKW